MFVFDVTPKRFDPRVIGRLRGTAWAIEQIAMNLAVSRQGKRISPRVPEALVGMGEESGGEIVWLQVAGAAERLRTCGDHCQCSGHPDGERTAGGWSDLDQI